MAMGPRSVFLLTPRRADALLTLGFVTDDTHVTREDVESAFRAAALRAHPDRPGGSTEAFQRVNEAATLLLEEELVPSDADVWGVKEMVARLDAKGILGVAPKGVWTRTRLSVTESIANRLSSARSIVVEAMSQRARSEARHPEVTGRSLQTADEQRVQKEMEELKLEEIRHKGVGRLVDRLVSEALRDGTFESELKGKPLPVDYYEAHLSTEPTLDRKLKAMLIASDALPEWVELHAAVDEDLLVLQRALRHELRDALRFIGSVDLPAYAPLVLSEAPVVSAVDALRARTRRYNCLCPPALQRPAGHGFVVQQLERELEGVLAEAKQARSSSE